MADRNNNDSRLTFIVYVTNLTRIVYYYRRYSDYRNSMFPTSLCTRASSNPLFRKKHFSVFLPNEIYELSTFSTLLRTYDVQAYRAGADETHAQKHGECSIL